MNGKAFERKIAQELEAKGYKIVFKSIATRFQRVDFGNKWDIVAVKDKEWVFVQCKSRMIYGEKMRNYVDWVAKHRLEGMRFYIVVKGKRRKQDVWRELC